MRRPAAQPATHTAWQVEGTLDAERTDAASEYCILVTVRNERNEEVARQVVNVGALQGAERRTFSLSIEVSDPKPHRRRVVAEPRAGAWKPITSAAAERNKQPILDELQQLLPRTGKVLEIASGTGQHVVHFAAALAGLHWQPTDRDGDRPCVASRRAATHRAWTTSPRRACWMCMQAPLAAGQRTSMPWSAST